VTRIFFGGASCSGCGCGCWLPLICVLRAPLARALLLLRAAHAAEHLLSRLVGRAWARQEGAGRLPCCSSLWEGVLVGGRTDAVW
jgi:hypothetical protein